MRTQLFRSKIHRIIGQLRFRPTLATYQAAPIIAKKLESKFPHWNIKKYYNVTLYNEKERKLMEVNYDSITYVNETMHDTKEMFDYVSQIYKDYVDSYGISKIRRIGFRYSQVLISELKYDDIVDLIYKKFYSKEEKIKKISADKQRDTVFVLDGLKNGFSNHVQIGPVKNNEISHYFNSAFSLDLSGVKDQNIFIDVDVSLVEDISKNDAIKKLEEASKENFRIVSEYLDYLNE